MGRGKASTGPVGCLDAGVAGAGPGKPVGHRITWPPRGPGRGNTKIPNYPGRAHRTKRGSGQKPKEHRLKLHTKGGDSREPRRKMNMGKGKPGGGTVLDERAQRRECCKKTAVRTLVEMKPSHRVEQVVKVGLRLLFEITVTIQKQCFHFFPTLPGILLIQELTLFEAKKFPIL